jgi:cell division protein FtsZ
MAIESPLLEISIEGATSVLYNITGGPDLSLLEIDEAAQIIAQSADPDANIIFGAAIDDNLGSDVLITLVAVWNTSGGPAASGTGVPPFVQHLRGR